MKKINIITLSHKKSIAVFSREIENKLNVRYADKTLCKQYAWWMLENVTGKKKPELISVGELDFTKEQLETLDLWVKKQVVEKEPLQYLLGSVPFCDLEILVEPPILIPRPETEQMCYYAISILQKMLQKLDNKKLTILDIGTGSGCIALSLAKALPESLVYAIDISDQALELAAKNATHNKINNVKLLNSNVYANIPKNINFDLIISNPPYITQEEFGELDESVARWEDKRALVASKQGLAIIEEIVTKASQFLKTSKLKINGQISDSKTENTAKINNLEINNLEINNLEINNLETNNLETNSDIKTQKIPQLIIEIGYKQGVSVSKLFKLARFTDIVVKKDLEDKNRFVTGRVGNVAIYKKKE